MVGMARVELAAGLDALVARRFAQPAVRRTLAELEAETRRRAPAGKVWLTAHDERVRTSHVATDGQEVPGNLRYRLPKPGRTDTDLGVDLARRPRDPDLPIGNRIRCRCGSLPLPGAVARHVRAGDVQVLGAHVSGRVTVTYPRIGESEFPEHPDVGGGWARAALREVAARGAGTARP